MLLGFSGLPLNCLSVNYKDACVSWVHYFPPREAEPQHLDGAYLRKLAVTGSEGKLVLLEWHRGTVSSQGRWAQMQAPGELRFSQ